MRHIWHDTGIGKWHMFAWEMADQKKKYTMKGQAVVNITNAYTTGLFNALTLLVG